MKRKPSFEAKYGPSPTADNTSDRSDSPLTQPPRILPLTTNHDTSTVVVTSSTGVRQITPSPVFNGDQTPPPVPPRIPMTQRSQTPPPSQDAQPPPFENIQSAHPHGLPVQITNQCPPTVIVPVNQAIQQNRDPPKFIVHSTSHVQHATNPQPQSQSPSSGPVTPQRGMSPVGPRQPVMAHSATSFPVAHPQFQQLTNHNGPISSARVTTGSGNNITIKYTQPPPPYSQSHNTRPTNAAHIHIHGSNTSDQSHIVTNPLPDQFRFDSSSANTSGSDSVQIKPSMAGHPMQTWGALSQPIVMHPVKSREVQKPVLQTATGPSAQASQQNQNYISSYQAQINPPNPSGLPPMSQSRANVRGDVQIHITRNPQHPQHPQQMTPEQLAHFQQTQRGRHHIKIQIQPGQHGPHYAHNVPIQQSQYGDLFQRSTSDTPISTPRSESPANSRATNQSPMSILSTTSTPSTNSDIPDKPPPPYPGRSVNVVQPIPKLPHQQIHQTNYPLPPPQYPPSTVQGFTPVQVHTNAFHSDSPQPPLPPRVPLQGQPAKLSQVAENSDTPPPLLPPKTTSQQPPPKPPPPSAKTSTINPPVPPSSSNPPQQINGANKHGEQTDETDETLSTVSDASSTQEKTRCTSPMPERKQR